MKWTDPRIRHMKIKEILRLPTFSPGPNIWTTGNVCVTGEAGAGKTNNLLILRHLLEDTGRFRAKEQQRGILRRGR